MIICTNTLKLEYCKKSILWIQTGSCIRFMGTIFTVKSMVWIMFCSIIFGLQKAKSQTQNKHLRTSWTCKASHYFFLFLKYVIRSHLSITSAKRWVGWVRKWQYLLIYSTIYADVGGWVGLKKPKTC